MRRTLSVKNRVITDPTGDHGSYFIGRGRTGRPWRACLNAFTSPAGMFRIAALYLKAFLPCALEGHRGEYRRSVGNWSEKQSGNIVSLSGSRGFCSGCTTTSSLFGSCVLRKRPSSPPAASGDFKRSCGFWGVLGWERCLVPRSGSVMRGED